MKKYNFNIHTLLYTFILVLFSFQAYAQRTCGSELDLEAIRNNDPATYEQMMTIERHTQQYTSPLPFVKKTCGKFQTCRKLYSNLFTNHLGDV